MIKFTMSISLVMDDYMPEGSRWLEVSTNRIVVVLDSGPDSPWLRYENDGSVFYCCAEDFSIWGRFRRLT